MIRNLFLIIFILHISPLLSWSQALIPATSSPLVLVKQFDQTLIKNLRFIYASSKELDKDILVLERFMTQIGLAPLQQKVSAYDAVHLQIDQKMSASQYSIQTKANQCIEIRGGIDGVFYGLMSLLQFMDQSRSHPKLAIANITDNPSYSWRGMHLDVSRHFFDKEFIKKYIDILALYKMNTFHWHLTDDQGWRIEIKKYPLLTKIGSLRKETIIDKNFDPYVGDGKPVSGYYTQEDIKEVIQYATERHVTVVPEIEMPGHAVAALSAYPEFSCNKLPLAPMTIWGVSDDVFCVNNKTIGFLKDILDEVLQLFPSKYIHIGGDEVPKTRWKKCPVCQQTMKANRLKDEHELQSYFIKQIDAYLTSRGRNSIGWDEILEGGLAPNAAVMSWRGEEGGIAAAKQKHNVVMSPGTHCYFDHYQGNKDSEPLAIGGYTPIEKVYAYEPTPKELNDAEKRYIIGAQANVWTEYIPTSQHVEYMAVPRLMALSEVLWTGNRRPGFDDFKQRLRKHFQFLDKLDVNYAKSIFDVRSTRKIVDEGIEIKLQSTFVNDSSKIRYYFTQEDGYLDIKDYVKEQPIVVNKTQILKAQYFEKEKAVGNVFTEQYLIHKALGKEITSTIIPSEQYNSGGMATLLDGKAGKLPRQSNEWLGWRGKNPEIVIDLKKEINLNNVKVYTLHDPLNWIYLPMQFELYSGSDGINYTLVESLDATKIEQQYLKNATVSLSAKRTTARYIKLQATCASTIKSGKPGEGELPWLFLTEIEVD